MVQPAISLYVPTSIKEGPDNKLLISEAKFGHSIQEGRVRIVDQDLKDTYLTTYLTPISSSDLSQQGSKSIVLAGGTNGVIYASDISSDNELGKQQNVFKVQSPLDDYEQKYVETLYEHSNAITSIETSKASQDKFLSTSLDSTVQLWQLTEGKIEFICGSEPSEVKEKGQARLSGVSAAVWTGADTVLYALENGRVMTRDFRSKENKSEPQIKEDSKIWDLKVFQDGQNYALALDNGLVRRYDSRKTDTYICSLAGYFDQSALALSINENRIAVGYSNGLKVYNNQELIFEQSSTEDNVSSVFLQGSALYFGMFNGSLSKLTL